MSKWERKLPAWSKGQQDSETMFYISHAVLELYYFHQRVGTGECPFGGDDREAWSFAEICAQAFYLLHQPQNEGYWDSEDYTQAIDEMQAAIGGLCGKPEAIRTVLNQRLSDTACHWLLMQMGKLVEPKQVEVEVTNTEVFRLTVKVPPGASEEAIHAAAEELWTGMDQNELNKNYINTPDRTYQVIGEAE